MTNAIAVEELRVGMFVQLEGGWLSHPFPLSSFKLTSTEQIEAVRRLGLQHVMWDRDKSDLAADAEPGHRSVEPDDAAVPITAACGEVGRVSTAATEGEVGTAADARSMELQAQRSATERCERQHHEALDALQHLMANATSQPEQAGRACVALTQAMLDKMLEKNDVGIRLVVAGPERETAHAMNVAVISLLIGRAMDLSPTELLDIGAGALLHDAGKSGWQTQHRHVGPGASSAEMLAYREHVTRGLQLGQRMGLPPGALQVLAQHHEHADGSGYPQHLAGEQISLVARVVCIVDRFDQLVNPLDAAHGLTPHEAVALLFAQYRQRFDAAVLNAFIRMTGVYPAGSLVQLTDDRFALVIGSNSSRPLKPRVLVYDARVPRDQALMVDLEQARDLGIRRSLGEQRVPADVLQYLDPKPRVDYFFEPLARTGAAL